MRQQSILQLQHCAILSQLNRHDDALALARETSQLLQQACSAAFELLKAKRMNEEHVQNHLEECAYIDNTIRHQ